jgi:hypothetical protein
MLKHNGIQYLPESDVMLLYVAWCSSEELWMATMPGFLTLPKYGILKTVS